MWIRVLIFLFELGFAVKFNLVGTISISELLLILAAPYLLLKINLRDRDMLIVSGLYLGLFVSQVLSELFVSNSPGNAMRGLAVTVVSFLHFIFLCRLLGKKTSLIAVLIFSLLITQFIAGPEEAIKEKDITLEDVSEGMGAALLKFYIAPLLTNMVLFASIFVRWKHFPLIIMLFGLSFIVLGARSSGLLALLTGLVSYLAITMPTLFRRRNVLISSAVILSVGYMAYCVYAYTIINGGITSGNSNQILLCDNPYNPIELLMRGRADVWVGWQAFMDHVLLGSGAWATDNSGHYLGMMQRLQNVLMPVGEDSFIIPVHSIIVGAGTSNGILAFTFMLSIVIVFCRYAMLSVRFTLNKYKSVLVFMMFSLLWNAMFSPLPQFRHTLPVLFSVIFILYHNKKKLERLYVKLDTHENE